MQNLTYLAVFEPSTDGSYSIYFPDLPGCISVGNNLEEAARMAAEAASLHVYSMECDNEEIPTPSVNLSKEDTEGNVVMPVTIHPDLFRIKKDNERLIQENLPRHPLPPRQNHPRRSSSRPKIPRPAASGYSPAPPRSHGSRCC